MRLLHLSLRHFRNVEQAVLEPHPRFNVLAGPNGAGKTNVLEAIHVLGSVKSFRDAKNRDLLQIGSRSGQVGAVVAKAGSRVEVRLDLDEQRKRFSVNDKGVGSLAAYLGTLVTVVFSPGDAALLRGSSGERRRYLDRLVCGLRPAHLADLQDLEAVLRARNRILRSGSSDRHLLAAYTQQLVPLASRVTARRVAIVALMRPLLGEVFGEIFAPEHALDWTYRCRWRRDEEPPEPDPEAIAPQLEAALTTRRADEQRAGHTLVGPQRDDLLVTLDGLPARDYASQGQSRAALLALKITEIRHLHDAYHEAPVLLLDDVSSELDDRRNAQLFAVIGELDGQTFITTTERRHVRVDGPSQAYAIRGGVIDRVVD